MSDNITYTDRVFKRKCFFSVSISNFVCGDVDYVMQVVILTRGLLLWMR